MKEEFGRDILEVKSVRVMSLKQEIEGEMFDVVGNFVTSRT